ncbi:MAG: tail fiber protein [Acidobacteria bacterium]|nr:tail fiber protein [Acidobacteriota bacterium]
MAEPFLSEIRIFSFNYAPKGWALCNGQLLPINQNQALFALLGTTYGGNGQTTFALPNLRGRVPIHEGAGFNLGQVAGAESQTLSIAEMPTHNHSVAAYDAAPDSNATSPVGAFYAETADASTMYFSGAADNAMAAGVISNTGGSQPHENRQPFLTLNFCIALQGIFPSQN